MQGSVSSVLASRFLILFEGHQPEVHSASLSVQHSCLFPCLAKNSDDHFSKRLKGSVFRVLTLSRSTFFMSEVAVQLSPTHTVGEWSHISQSCDPVIC